MEKTYIYFIQATNGPIKIGLTKNVQRRLVRLQTGNPYKLSLLYFCPAKGVVEEQLRFHLKSDHMRGEWYWPTQKVFNVIKKKMVEDAEDEQAERQAKERHTL